MESKQNEGTTYEYLEIKADRHLERQLHQHSAQVKTGGTGHQQLQGSGQS